MTGPRALVVPVGLFLSACAPKAPAEPEAASAPAAEVPPVAPPSPTLPGNPPRPLPTWDEVPSPHPPGATNPPSPVLLRTPEGRCYEQWVSPFLPREYHVDRVTACPSPDEVVGDCGTEIVCPPDAVARTAPRP